MKIFSVRITQRSSLAIYFFQCNALFNTIRIKFGQGQNAAQTVGCEDDTNELVWFNEKKRIVFQISVFWEKG